MCDICKAESEKRRQTAVLTRNIEFYESIIDGLRKNLHDLAEIMVDAELITRSRCHELTGMSHSEIGQLLANSPIAKDAAKTCIDECHKYFRDTACTGDYAAQHIAEAIRSKFHLSV